MDWDKESQLFNDDNDLNELFSQRKSEHETLEDLFEDDFEKTGKSGKIEAPYSQQNTANPIIWSVSKNSGKVTETFYECEKPKKLSQYELSEKLLQNVEIYTLQGSLYAYEHGLFFPFHKKQMVKLLHESLLPQEYEILTSSDFKGLYTYLNEYAFNISPLEEIPIRPGLAFCQNGKFDVVSREKIPEDDRSLCFHQINANYYPEDEIQTPVFDQYLQILSGGDKEIQDLIWASIGYLLIHDPGGKCFHVLAGVSNSGKSQLIKLLEKLIGADHVSHIEPQKLGGRFELGSLIGCSLNTAADLSSDGMPPIAVSQLKKLCGGDYVQAEKKFENSTPLLSVAKFIFATNFSIKIKENDFAMWNRIVIIPCLHAVDRKNQDKRLVEKFWEERDGIVTKALEAVREVILHNYQFPPCKQAEMMKENWINTSFSNVHNFVVSCCDLTSLTSRTSTKDLHFAYQNYCDRMGLIPESENAFSRALTKEFSLKSVRVESLRGFQGIQLKKQQQVQSRIVVISPGESQKGADNF